MLFLTYWELNEDMNITQRLQIAEKLQARKLFPPNGTEIVRWDITPDGWGILLLDAPDPGAVAHALDIRRIAGTGFFKVTRTSPAIPVTDSIAVAAELIKKLS